MTRTASPRERRLLWLRHPFWRLLPEGFWTLSNGEIVVFSRARSKQRRSGKSPIARVSTFNPPEPLDPEMWCDGIVHDKRFYSHENFPGGNLESLSRVLDIANQWGLGPEIGLRLNLADFGRRPVSEWARDWRLLRDFGRKP